MRLSILIRGAGEVASAVAHKLARSGFQICLTELDFPQAIHRGTCFSEAMFEGEKEVEGVIARLASSPDQVFNVWKEGKIALIVDPQATVKDFLHPDVLIDAVMAKRNLGTKITDAPLVIGLGPGFKVGQDVHLVVETNNSENLGKVVTAGEAEPNTGIPLFPSLILRSPKEGSFYPLKKIGDLVTRDEIIARVDDQSLITQIDGVVRALLRVGAKVIPGTKVGEIDPRGDPQLCYTIRPRMRAIAGGVLEAIMMWFNTNKANNVRDLSGNTAYPV